MVEPKYITHFKVEKWINSKSGQSTGRIQHSDSLLRAVGSLIKRSGVTAVAVVARFPDDDSDDIDDYRQGMVCYFALLQFFFFFFYFSASSVQPPPSPMYIFGRLA